MPNERYRLKIHSLAIEPDLIYVSHAVYGEDWISVLHSHTTTELLYIISGRGELVTANGTHFISTGDFLIIPPHFLHTEKSSRENRLEYYVLGVRNIIPKGLGSEEDFKPVISLTSSHDLVRDYIYSIYREIKKQEPGYEIMAKSLFNQLTVLLVRRKKIDIQLERGDNIKRDVATVKQYIDEHYSDSISLDTLALLSYKSKFHLVREFKKETGYTPIEYLIFMRIQEAKLLLSSTEMSILDISSSLGFSSPSYFAQRFKRSVGMTPVKYRNSKEEKNSID